MSFTFGSVCSGMEAASLAWNPLGARCAFVAEIDTAACQLLAERHPDVPNLGDLTKWRDWPPELLAQIDVLIGGTPCQGFSFAGLRKSLSDDRSNLALQFLELADAIDALRRAAGRPALVIVWENVPGVYSTADNAFGCFIGRIVGADAPLVPGRGQKWTHAGVADGPARKAAWRTLDAQFFGLAQRRARVFVIASAGALCPAQVLLERCSVPGNPAPRREAGQGTAGAAEAGVAGGVAKALKATDGGVDREDGHTLVPVAFKASHYTRDKDRAPHVTTPPLSADADKGDQDTLVLAFGGNNTSGPIDVATALRAESGGSTRDLVAFADVADPLVVKEGETYTQEGSGNFRVRNVVTDLVRWAVRRLTPTECERLQGAPDGHTLVKVRRVTKNNAIIAAVHDAGGGPIILGKKGAERPYQLIDGEVWALMADGPRYKLLGNSKAIPVVAWIGSRIILAMEAAANG